jgi:hypothetical protein
MLVYIVFKHVDKIRTLLTQSKLDVTVGDAQVWKPIWDCLQLTSMTMWCLDSGCAVAGPAYIRHILASKRLADRFEERGEVDNAMYKDILR